MFQLEAEGYTLTAIQNLWISSSAAGNSHFHHHHGHPSQTNPMEYHPEPILQIGYIHFLFVSNTYIRTYIHASNDFWTGTITMIHLRDRLQQRAWLVGITSFQDGLFQRPLSFRSIINWSNHCLGAFLYWDLHCYKVYLPSLALMGINIHSMQ